MSWPFPLTKLVKEPCIQVIVLGLATTYFHQFLKGVILGSSKIYKKNFIYRKIAKTSRTYIKMSTFQIRVIFEILLNSIVCFLQFSSGYIRVRVIIKVDLFSGFYGTYLMLF